MIRDIEISFVCSMVVQKYKKNLKGATFREDYLADSIKLRNFAFRLLLPYKQQIEKKKMEEKKKFVKPEMKVIEMKSEVRVLAGSDCVGVYSVCPYNTAG